jgi:hypothetical protein
VDSHPGNLYLSPDKSLGIFVPHEFNIAARNIINEVLAGASTAGPGLDRDVLRNLTRIVGQPTAQQDENGPPVVLSRDEALHFEAIMAQFDLRYDLPDRIKRTCPVCDTTTIEDPAHLAQRAKDIQRDHDRNTFINNVAARQLIDSGHTVEGVFRMLLAPKKPSLDLPCHVCGGRQFDRSRTTFCPECHNRRDEFLLLQCPYCEHDFVASVREHIWTTGANALLAFNISYKQSAVINAVRALDRYALDKQIKFLLGHITADTSIFGVARCALIDNRKRDTVLLVTSECICWSSKRFLVLTEDSSLKWEEVADVSSNTLNDVRLALSDGRTITFASFLGDGRALGVGASDRARAFDAQTIRHLITAMGGG